MPALKLNYKIWIETDEGENIFGEGKYKLLKAIDESQSLKHAVESLGLTYRKTWNNLRKIEETLGFPLLITSRGGSTKGSTQLSPQAKELIKAFDLFHEKYRKDFMRICEKINVECLKGIYE